MKKIIIIIGIVIFCIDFSYSQNKVDSLTNILKNCKSDTAKIYILNNLVMGLYNTDPDLCFKYANQAYKISQTENYKKHFTETLNALAVANWAVGSYEESLSFLFEKLKIHEQKKTIR